MIVMISNKEGLKTTSYPLLVSSCWYVLPSVHRSKKISEQKYFTSIQEKKSRILETLNLLTVADSSTDTFFLLAKAVPGLLNINSLKEI